LEANLLSLVFFFRW